MKEWYSIQSKSDRSAKISIHEQIGENFWGEGTSAKKFISDLDALDVDRIDLHINSPGGSVFEGNAIYNALKQHRAKVTVTVDGIAASIASVIAMAGDKILMPQNSMMMIHDPWGITMGTSADMRKTAEALDKIKGGIVASYMTRANQGQASIEEMMSSETWFTAQEAVDIGFADEIVEDVKAQNCAFDMLSRFKNVPKQVFGSTMNTAPRGGARIDTHTEEVDEMITLEKIKSEHPDIAKALIDEGMELGRKDGAAAELKRIKDVQAQLLPGHEALVQSMIDDGTTTGEQAAMRILQAEKQIRVSARQSLEADGKEVPNVPVSNSTALDSGDQGQDLSTEEGMKAAWEKDSKLRAEFGNQFEIFKAYQENKHLAKVRG